MEYEGGMLMMEAGDVAVMSNVTLARLTKKLSVLN